MKVRIFKIFSISSLFSFSTSALAEESAAAAGAGGGMMGQMLMIGVLFAMMYFLMIRPQSKKAKEHKNLVSNLKEDDEIVTNGGLLGKISKVTDNCFLVTFADGVEVPVQKQAVTQALPKGTIKAL